jgi:hypothetical protein
MEYPVENRNELAHFLRWEINGAEYALGGWGPRPIDISPDYWAGYLAGVTNALNKLEGMTE